MGAADDDGLPWFVASSPGGGTAVPFYRLGL